MDHGMKQFQGLAHGLVEQCQIVACVPALLKFPNYKIYLHFQLQDTLFAEHFYLNFVFKVVLVSFHFVSHRYNHVVA